jgi:hypothetical protein
MGVPRTILTAGDDLLSVSLRAVTDDPAPHGASILAVRVGAVIDQALMDVLRDIEVQCTAPE